MNELIARVRGATGPYRELDCCIWAEINNRDTRIVWCEQWGSNALLAKSRTPPYDEFEIGVFDCNDSKKFYTVGQSDIPARYTASIDAAMTLAIPRWTPNKLSFPRAINNKFYFEIFPPTGHQQWNKGSICESGNTSALAIVIGWLKARNLS